MRTAAAAAGNTLALLAVTSAVCLLGAHAQTGVEGGETPTLPPGAPSKACPVPPFSPRYLTDTCCGKVLWPGRAHQPCCGNIAYDSAVDGCCQGVLAPGYGRLPAYSCCGVVAYDPSSSICCDGRVYDSVLKRFTNRSQMEGIGRTSNRLCSNVALRRALIRPLLASGVALLLQLLWLSPTGGQENQPHNGALVSADLVQPGAAGLPGPPTGGGPATCSLSKPWYSCCGPLEYDPFNATCCGGFLVVGRPFAACCGRLAYDADRQGCCNGRVVERSVSRGPLACCGTTGYDPTTYTCCGSTVMQRSPVMACCGGKPYFFPEPIGPLADGTTGAAAVGDAGAPGGAPADGPPGSPSSSKGSAVCCGCRLYNVKGQRGKASCCGEVPYDTTTQLCCNGALHSIVGKQSPRCCGAALVDESTSTSCCQGRPYRYGPFGPLCCPDGTLNSCCFYPQSNATACI